MDIVGYHIPVIVTAATAATTAFTAVLGAFARFDKDQSDDNRKFVRDWLLGLKVDTGSWNQFFLELFSRFFGSKHLSLKCVTRSFTLSFGIITGILLVFTVRRVLTGESTIDSETSNFYPFGLALACGIVADYFSLWKTRFILTRINLFSNWFVALAAVIGDFLATTLILEIMYSIAMILDEIFIALWFDAGLFPLGPAALHAALFAKIILFGGVLEYPPKFDSMGAWLYVAALLTSAWLWVYLLVAYGMRGFGVLLRWIAPLSKFMDFENHPVRTIGYVAATISAVVVGVFGII